MIELKTKYGIDNNEYRLLKEITLVEFDLDLLYKAKRATAELISNDNSLKVASDKWNAIEDIITDRETSIAKKKHKLSVLKNELKEMRSGNCRI